MWLILGTQSCLENEDKKEKVLLFDQKYGQSLTICA